MFDNFLQATSSCGLKITDIKYLESDYFFNNANHQTLKERSVRKQFVYEYLLQQHIENNHLKNMNIKSDFWLPFYLNNFKVFEEQSEYLNGYISLKNINFAAIVDVYLY